VRRPDGEIEEHDPPARLPPNEVTVVDVYGHLFYAGARTLERLLPRPQDTQKPVVVLRLRSLGNGGATLMEVLANYADELAEVDGRLYLNGISEDVHDQFVRGQAPPERSGAGVRGRPVRLEATRKAVADAGDPQG